MPLKETSKKFKIKITAGFLILLILMPLAKVLAQEPTPFPDKTYEVMMDKKDTARKKSLAEQKDIFDIVTLLFKKHADTTNQLVSPSTKPIYAFVPAIGYSLQTKLAAVVSGNIAFHASPSARVSTITTSVTYTQNKQFFIPFLTNISTKNNGFKLVGDLRFYKYPQSTFGLGSSALLVNEDPMDYYYLRFYETVLKKIKGNFFVGAGYDLDYHWRISHKGNKNGTASDYSKYDTSRKTTSSGITLNGIYDSRDNPINAKKGFFTSVQLRNNFKAIGSNSNWRSVIIDVRKYFSFGRTRRNTLAFWSYNALVVNGKPPYLDLPSTGWDNYNATGRGFIQGRYRGTEMVYLETEYRFGITSNGLLGGVLFGNEEAFSGAPRSTIQTFQGGYGGGLRIKLNKLSNTNLSIDYGFGTQGSKGLFITVGEAF